MYRIDCWDEMLAIVVLRAMLSEQIWFVEPELGKRLYLFPSDPAQSARPKVEAVVGAFLVQRNPFALPADLAWRAQRDQKNYDPPW